MKISCELEQGYIDVWNEESKEWDRYIKVNKKTVVEENKIPEKFKVHSLGDKDENGYFVSSPFPTDEEFMNKINDIIDYLDYLKSKGE